MLATELSQPVERVRLQMRKARVHDGWVSDGSKSLRDRRSMIVETSTIVPPAPLRWPWRIASLIATAISLALLAYVIVSWGWRWLGPQPLPLPSALLATEPWAPAIVASPLFGRSMASAPVSADPPAALPGDTRLLGVFAERDGAGYALFRSGARGPILVQAGQEIAPDVTLVQVRPDGVRIRDRGETRDLALRTTATMPSIAPARGAGAGACQPPPGYKGSVYRLNAELLTGIASRPEGWQAVLTPVAGGLAIREGSGFAAMLGMKPGDRMAQANGIALAGIDDVLVAFVRPLVASQAVRVSGTRDGKPADWVFVNAGACPG